MAPLVLAYRSVGDPAGSPDRRTVSVQRFAAQLGLLARLGIRGCSMAELCRPSTRPRVGLTFDDGYRDFVTAALPLLVAHRFTATVFVLAGRLGGSSGWRPAPERPLVTAPEVREIAAAGMEVGSHGLRHRDLRGVSGGELRAELVESRAILEDTIDAPVTGFSYPYGSCGDREVAAVRDAGYQYAAAAGTIRLPRRWAFPRWYAGEPDTGARLVARRARHLVGV